MGAIAGVGAKRNERIGRHFVGSPVLRHTHNVIWALLLGSPDFADWLGN